MEAQRRLALELEEREKRNQQEVVKPQDVTPIVAPSAPNLIGYYPAPPTVPSAVPQDSVVGNNLRDQGAPAAVAPESPTNTFSSLFSVHSG